MASSDKRDRADAVVRRRLEHEATVRHTPCGSGSLVWRRWGAGPVVVLLHGGFGSWTHWIRNVDTLRRRFTVVAPDLPGLGDSAEPPEPYDATSVAAVTWAGITDVVEPAGSIALVGFSFGAIVAGVIAAGHPERVASLTIVGPSGLGTTRAALDLRSWRRLEGTPESEAHRHNLAVLMIADASRVGPATVDLQAENARRARLRSRPIAATPALRDALPTVAAPLQVIYGARDATVATGLAERERLLRSIRPDLRWDTIPEAGHWVQYEAAERFDQVLGSFLAGTVPSAA
jgi:pimeloyl-ACP methyl ester carboxylesterase